MKKIIVLLFSVFTLLMTNNAFAVSEANVAETITGTGVKWLGGCDGLGIEANENSNIPCSETPDNNFTTWFGGRKDSSGNETADGAIPSLFAMTGSLYDAQPADTALYFADLFHQTPFLTDTAYAQEVGIGFAALSPVLGIWKVFRNMSYLLFTLAFVVVGFAIMFRAKLNPQTVVNIQLALPRMVITLLLITFSYAIAGLMVDLMYISIYMIIFMFGGMFNGTFVAQAALNNNILDNILRQMFEFGEGDGLVTRGAESVGALVAGALGFDQSLGFENLGTNIVGAIAGFGVGLLFLFIFLIVIFYKAFKIFFSLLSAYIQIILLVITGPLRLMLNIYPGSNAFTSWLKELAANLAVFPAVLAMLLIGFALMGIETKQGIGYDTTQITGFSPPQLYFKDQRAIMGLLGIGIILGLDQVAEKVKGLFGVGGGGGQGGGGGAFAGGLLGGGIGATLAPGLAPFKMAGRMVSGIGMNAATQVAGTAMTDLASNRIPWVKKYQANQEARKIREEVALVNKKRDAFRAAREKTNTKDDTPNTQQNNTSQTPPSNYQAPSEDHLQGDS